MRIQQEMIFISQLLKDITAGKTIPAGMQRPYVWTRHDVISLCESIAQRFPIGGILTWSPKEMNLTTAKPRLGPIYPKNDTATRLILDGQNRLATLAWIAQANPTPENIPDASEAEQTTWLQQDTLVYDWKTKSFCFMEPKQAQETLTLPVKAAFSSGGRDIFNRWKEWEALGYKEDDVVPFLESWDHICQGFQETRIIETCLLNASPKEAKDAFLKICKTGVPINEKDFQNALNWLN